MASYSAWAKWYASQHLANTLQPISQEHIMLTASSIVLDNLMDGKLLARRRPSGAIEYENISKEAWRLVAIQMKPHPLSLWHGVIIPRGNVDPARIAKLLDYDSIIVNSREFEQLWPTINKHYDNPRQRLLKGEKSGRRSRTRQETESRSYGDMALALGACRRGPS
jgi:hypothetical protein